MSLPPSQPAAFILAGGQSSRMGHYKALVPLAGIPLIQHACNLIRSVGLEPRIAGAQGDLSSFAPTLADDATQPGLGPLSGICSALATTSAQFALFLPVDLPLLPPSLIDCMLRHALITEALVTVPSVAGFTQTFPAVIDPTALPSLRSSLSSGDRNTLRAFQAAGDLLSNPISILPVEMLLQAGQISSPRAVPPGQWFLNLNTPEDLARAETLLADQRLQVI